MTHPLLPTLFLLPVLAACGDPKPESAVPRGITTGQTLQRVGEVAIGGHTFRIVQDGPVVAGKQASFLLESVAVDRPLPTARVWIGVQSVEGSKKANLSKVGDGTLHGLIDVPAVLPRGAMLWLEVDVGGAEALNSFEWHR